MFEVHFKWQNYQYKKKTQKRQIAWHCIDHEEDICFQYRCWNKKAECCLVWPLLGTCAVGPITFSATLHISTNNCKRPRVLIRKLHKFTNVDSCIMRITFQKHKTLNSWDRPWPLHSTDHFDSLHFDFFLKYRRKAWANLELSMNVKTTDLQTHVKWHYPEAGFKTDHPMSF